MIRTVTKLTPMHHGQRMTLAEFEPAISEDGRLYELSRGVVIYMDVPGLRHMLQVCDARDQLVSFHVTHPKKIYAIAAGSDCKIVLEDFDSERHPDLAVYLSPPPDEKRFWAYWIPDIVIEIVSLGSEERDYVLKREEYFHFGIKEYWIIDSKRQEMLVLRRGAGGWQERVIKPGRSYQTKLLPGFKFDCQAVFKAADKAPRSKGGKS
jgi:Uma2 family endonuclease